MASPLYVSVIDQNNNPVKGPVQVKGRENTFEAIAASHEITLPADKDNGVILGNRVHAPFVITKLVDGGSPTLKKMLCEGAALKAVCIDFYRTVNTGKEEKYYQIKLEDARVTHVGLSVEDVKKEANKTQGHRESVGFIYGKISESYLPDNIGYTDEWRDRGS